MPFAAAVAFDVAALVQPLLAVVAPVGAVALKDNSFLKPLKTLKKHLHRKLKNIYDTTTACSTLT